MRVKNVFLSFRWGCFFFMQTKAEENSFVKRDLVMQSDVMHMHLLMHNYACMNQNSPKPEILERNASQGSIPI